MSLHHAHRRRLLTDGSLPAILTGEDEPQVRLAGDDESVPNLGSSLYSAAVQYDHQRPLLDWFPTRYLTIGLTLVVGLILVSLIELLHLWSGSLAHLLGARDVEALSLDGARNISHWFCSTLLTLSGLAALAIYSLRRHRVDDYHGRYRVWIWTTLGCWLASLAETSDIVQLAHGIGRRAAELCSLPAAILWPVVAGGICFVMGLRLLLEVRKCPTALGMLSLGMTGFLLTASIDHGWPAEVSTAHKTLLERGCWLTGYVLILAAFLLYIRHVLLEIEGLVVVAPYQPKRSKSKSAACANFDQRAQGCSAKPTLQLRTDLEPVEKPAARVGLQWAANPPAASSNNAHLNSGDGSSRVLSRAERRRLRREAKKAS